MKKDASRSIPPMNPSQELIPTLTADGSLTFFSLEFHETFHSLHGAQQEAQRKFVEPILGERTHQSLKLLDICYGLGYNTAAALTTIWATNPNCHVQLWGLELNVAVPDIALKQGFLNVWPAETQQVARSLATRHHVKTDRLQAQLLIGDARQSIQQVYQSGFQADGVFLDPFSPPRCPQLWTIEFLDWVVRCLQPTGKLVTYSCSAAVRAALAATGCHIGSTDPVGRRSPGTIASLLTTDLPPLSQQEQEHLHTRAAIPYRDPSLSDSAAAILQRRSAEQQASDLEPTSQWKKRWLNKANVEAL